ncbi:DUF4293 domain-containing protein [Reichenbachiella sp. MALMAid0571]|uniref:DUF4293 domain-containing protein n=1 Tax=Reichenbachiella sp. MALMAid0571 TaxID=3143939 RepID=UPI0032DF0920
MIQRIQSIFLLLVAVTMITMLFFPLWQKVDTDNKEKITLTAWEVVHDKANAETQEAEIISKSPVYPVAGLAVLAAIIAVFSIFKYENRLMQMKLGALNSLVIGACLGFAVYFIFDAEKVLPPLAPAAYLPGFYFSATALFFNALANRFIRRDENLVRSADRIR